MRDMKRLLAILFVFVLFLTYTTTAHAQGVSTGFVSKTIPCYAKALDEAQGLDCPVPPGVVCQAPGNINKEGFDTDSFRTGILAINKELIGIGATNCDDKKIQEIMGSAVGSLSSTMDTFYQEPPASGVYYARHVLENAGFAKPAYAQGVGYAALSPLIEVWKVFRNMAYVILVVVLVVIGFMIMFRMKLDPQTAITIQNALPNIVITLIVITFSYAIAGLLIDIMYFSMNIVISLVYNAFGSEHFGGAGPTEIQAMYTGGGYGVLVQNVLRTMPTDTTTSGLVGIGAGTATTIGLLATPAAPIALIVGGLVALFGSTVQGGGVAGLLSPILFLIVGLGLLFVIIRLFFMLLSSYIQVLLRIIFAPLMLLPGAIPGKNAFSGWIRGLLGNLIVFPTVAGTLLIANILTDMSENIWVPPLLGGTGVGSFAQGLIGLGVVMLAPTLAIQAKKLFEEQPTLNVSPTIITAPATATAQSGLEWWKMYEMYGGRQLIDKFRAPFRGPGGEPSAPTTGEVIADKAKSSTGVAGRE
jgi:hypothetical protein